MAKSKKILFYSLLTVLIAMGTLALMECAGFLCVSFHIKGCPPRSELLKTLDVEASKRSEGELVVSDNRLPFWMQPHVIHPYIGFVQNHTLPRQVFDGRVVHMPANEYGFFGPLPDKEASDKKVTIAIAGGSVALELFLYAGDVLRQELQRSPRFADKEIEIVSLALGGMKQPQQLMALNYFLALGFRYDIVVNCDGFNEVALPFANNVPFNINPFYPRAWGIYAAKSMNIQAAVLYGRMNESRTKVERWRTFVSRSPFRHSHFFLFLWHLVSTREENRQTALDGQIREILRFKEHTHPQETGPSFHYSSDAEMFFDFAGFWKRCSVQMWKICKDYQIKYYHFLQPNQYVPGSKTLSVWEREHIYAGPENLSRQAVEKGYPLLSTAGDELVSQGVPFFDLTALFAGRTETMYRDNSCHYNQAGNELLARKVASVLAGR
jgi:hypothetical protein